MALGGAGRTDSTSPGVSSSGKVPRLALKSALGSPAQGQLLTDSLTERFVLRSASKSARPGSSGSRESGSRTDRAGSAAGGHKSPYSVSRPYSSRPFTASSPLQSPLQFVDVPNSGNVRPGTWITKDKPGDLPTIPLGTKATPTRIDRWTPRHSTAATSRPATQTLRHPGTAGTETSHLEEDTHAETEESMAFSRGYTQKELDDIRKIQDKIKRQLKDRKKFKIDTSDHNSTLTSATFKKTLHRYGIDLPDDECEVIFKYYDKDGGGELDHQEFIQGIRGSDFVSTSLSYGFETPDPGYHVDNDEGGLGHFVDLAGAERETALRLGTARCSKAWSQQRSLDSCPFGTDRRMFGGLWQYRTSQLIKGEPVVAPRYGKTSFPARKELSDVMAVIASKLEERSRGALAFTRMFNQFDKDKNGSIDRDEFNKLLDVFNIELNERETKVVFEHFGAECGGIRYTPFVKTVVAQGAIHPLGGLAGNGFGTREQRFAY